MTEEMKAKRQELAALSRAIKSTGAFDSVNEGLVELYRQEGHTEIHSFKQWLAKGFCVRKGEKALLLWGQPRKADNKQKQQEGEDDEFKFWPLAYVFSQKQVAPLKTAADVSA